MRRIAIATLFWFSFNTPVRADNWGHWRGPTGNGIALNGTPPTQWSNTKNVKWKVEVPGRSSASPIVWEDSVFVATAVPISNELFLRGEKRLFCISATQ